MVLECFTKNNVREKELFIEDSFLNYWFQYIRLCADEFDIFKFMRRNEICTDNHLLYENNGLIYESNHDFLSANKVLIEGLDKKVDNIEAMRKAYSLFEQRMEKRTNREKTNSLINAEELEKVIRHEYSKLQVGDITAKSRKYPFEEQYPVRKRTFEENLLESTAKYGNVAIYVDEEHRNKIIEKGTGLVERYTILVNYLIKNDKEYNKKNEQFQIELKKRQEMKPYSWVNGLRVLPEQLVTKTERTSIDKDTPEFKKKNEIDIVNNIQNTQIETVNNKPEVVKVIEDNGRKFKYVKVDKPKKECTYSIDFSKHIVNGEYISPIEMRVRIWLANNKPKSSRKTIICKVDEDGDIIMSSDEEDEEKQPVKKTYTINRYDVNVKPINNIKVNSLEEPKVIKSSILGNNKVADAFTSLNNKIRQEDVKPIVNPKNLNKPVTNLNLFQNNNSADDLLKQLNKIDELWREGKITEVEKCQYISQIEEQLHQIEVKNVGVNQKVPESNPFLPKKNDFRKYLEPTIKHTDTVFSNVSRSLDFSNINVVEEPPQKPKSNFSTLFQGIDLSADRDKELFQATPDSSKRQEVLFRAFIKDTPELRRPEKEKRTETNMLRNNLDQRFESQLHIDKSARQQQLALAFGNEMNNSLGLSIITEKTEKSDNRSIKNFNYI
jgi:hypothetical protein